MLKVVCVTQNYDHRVTSLGYNIAQLALNEQTEVEDLDHILHLFEEGVREAREMLEGLFT